MTLKASIEAMHHDAKLWQDVADVTGTAASEPENFKLGLSELSWASESTGLLDTYEEIRVKVARLLDEGTDNFHSLSAALDKVAATLEATDQAAAQKLKGIWDPHL